MTNLVPVESIICMPLLKLCPVRKNGIERVPRNKLQLHTEETSKL